MKGKLKVLYFIVTVFAMTFLFSAVALAEDPVDYGTIEVTGTGIEDQSFAVVPGEGRTLKIAKGTDTVDISFSGASDGISLQQGSTDISVTPRSISVSGSYISFVIQSSDPSVGDMPFTLTLEKISADIRALSVSADGSTLSVTQNGTIFTATEKVSHAVDQATIEVTPDTSGAVVAIDGTSGVTSKQVALSDGVNVFSVRVEVGGLTATYSVIIERFAANESNNANLAGLTVSGASISPSFSASQLSYTASVVNTVSTASVNVTPADASATLAYTWNGTTVSSTSSLALNVGDNTLRITVMAANGTTNKIYTLTVNRASATDSSNYYLSSVSISPSSGSAVWASGSFRRTTTSYTITIPRTATTVRFRPVAESSSATIKVNGTTVASGSYSNSISVSSSSTTRVEIVVKASNGQSQTYTFRVSRSSSDSDDATLKKLVVKYGSTTYNLMPVFDEDVEDYYVCVPEKASYITITPTSTESGCNIEVDGDDVSSGSASGKISIDTGSSGNEIEIEVTSPDGSENITYTVCVYRSSATSGTVKTLDSLDLKTGKSTSSMTAADFTSDFDEDTTSYTAYIDSTHKYASVKASFANSKSLVFLITDESVLKVSDDKYSGTVSLSSGVNDVVVRVYNAMYSSYTDYNIKINRGGSSENTLSSLIVKDNNGKVVSLSPSFTRYTYNYIATVGQDVTGVRFLATPRDSNASMKLDGVSLKSDTSSSLITLSDSSTVIRLAVTATDGTVQNYTVTIKKGTDTTVGAVALSLKIGSPAIMYNGMEKQMDVSPFVYNNRTMVPLRFISTYLGATVDWNEATKTVTIKYGTKTLTMVIGKSDAAAGLDVPPMLKNDRTMVPLRYISEQFGAKVDWYAATQEIRISRQ